MDGDGRRGLGLLGDDDRAVVEHRANGAKPAMGGDVISAVSRTLQWKQVRRPPLRLTGAAVRHLSAAARTTRPFD